MKAKQGAVFAAQVWAPERWRRGSPPTKTIRAHQHQVHCAAGPGHRAAIKQSWAADRAAYYQRRRHELYCRSGTVIEGRVSYFGGGLMASGHLTSEPAIALNIAPGTESGWNNSLTRSWVASQQRFRVTIAGHTAVLFVGDLGPAGFTQRAIDVTEGGVSALGLGGIFPTDAWGKAKLLPDGCT